MRFRGTVYSKTLDMDTSVTVVAPNRLKREGEYKVAYLLHGLCSDSGFWLDYSMLPYYANLRDTVYIMPQVGRSFYSDMKHGFDYFTYITEELPKICKNLFRISAKREDTAVLGVSMGGYGALKCALTKPEQYGSCAAFSSACLFMREAMAETAEKGITQGFIDAFGRQLPRDFAAIFGDDLNCPPECDLPELAKRAAGAGAKPKIYMTCGTRDPFYEDNLKFCKLLDDCGLQYEFESWDAEHDFECFNDALKKAIEKLEL